MKMNPKIIVVTYKNPKDGDKLYVDFGVDMDTMKEYVLPNVPLYQIPTYFDSELNEYILTPNKNDEIEEI